MFYTKTTAAAAFLLLGSCTCCLNEDVVTHCGTFEGTLPAADGPGIKMTLVLGEDSSFREHSVYIDRPEAVFDETGTYTVEGNVITLHLSGGERNYYQIEKNQIRRLDMEGKPITGALAEYYILTQTQPCE